MSTISNRFDTKAGLRPPDKIMKLSRMGAFHASRLSFMRVLLRRLRRDLWTFERPRFDIDENGVGVATYRAIGPHRTYTLVAFAHDLPSEKRSDRVIADAWDATFTLFDGEPTDEDIERLRDNVPLQEAGRISEKEFVLSRANKSVRLFNHILDCLARGAQPAREEINKIGYLMRTTAVYGSGKFGAADRNNWKDREEFLGSFQPELLSVWFIRSFAVDWLEHQAFAKGGENAVKLDRELKRLLGIGNSTGLGMAPFLINHPALIHSWISAREEALARIRSLPSATVEAVQKFSGILAQAIVNAQNWLTIDPRQTDKVLDLCDDLENAKSQIASGMLEAPMPWDMLYLWSEKTLSLEGQEQIVSLMLEPYGDLVDELSDTMSANERAQFRIDGVLTIGELKTRIERHYGWGFDLDFKRRSTNARIWYVSRDKLEPRLGERFEEDLEPYEQALAPARDAMRLRADIENYRDGENVATLLLKHPEHRHIVRRLQILECSPYGEIRNNTIDADMQPINLLRCKLSFFGATRFDPRSDRWVRITMYQHAPYPDELQDLDPDDHIFESDVAS